MNKFLNGRSESLIDKPGKHRCDGEDSFVDQPNVRYFSNLAPFHNGTVVRSQWKKPKIVPIPKVDLECHYLDSKDLKDGSMSGSSEKVTPRP